MHIDKSLANGLTSRLVTEVSEDVEALAISIIEKARAIKFNKKTSPAKVQQIAREILGSYLLSDYIGGSINNPYYGMVFAHATKNRTHNDWNEKAVFGFSLVLTLRPFVPYEAIPRFVVSQHAISRIYQRMANKISRDEIINPSFVLSQLAHVPLWSTYWFYIHNCLNRNVSIGRINLVVPASQGLLFGYSDFISQTAEIRTFVSDDLLSQEQLRIKQLLLNSGSLLQSSPMAIGILLEKLALDMLAFDESFLSPGLVGARDELAEIIFKEAENQAACKRDFFDLLNEGHEVSVGLMQLFKEHGVRKAHAILRDELIKIPNLRPGSGRNKSSII